MFNLNASMRYWFYAFPTDMRKGFYTLSGLVTDQMGQNVRSGDVFIFLNRSLNKHESITHMEHGGLVIYYMKLEKGNFALPSFDENGKTHPFFWQKLMLMVQGIDAEKCHYNKRCKSA